MINNNINILLNKDFNKLTRSALSCVRPFCAASCNGVKPQLSVAFTVVLCLIKRAARSKWPYEEALCKGIKPPLSWALTSAPCSKRNSATSKLL